MPTRVRTRRVSEDIDGVGTRRSIDGVEHLTVRRDRVDHGIVEQTVGTRIRVARVVDSDSIVAKIERQAAVVDEPVVDGSDQTVGVWCGHTIESVVRDLVLFDVPVVGRIDEDAVLAIAERRAALVDADEVALDDRRIAARHGDAVNAVCTDDVRLRGPTDLCPATGDEFDSTGIVWKRNQLVDRQANNVSLDFQRVVGVRNNAVQRVARNHVGAVAADLCVGSGDQADPMGPVSEVDRAGDIGTNEIVVDL